MQNTLRPAALLRAPIPPALLAAASVFGYGLIRTVEDNKLEIAFDKAGDKKVMDAFVERA